MRLRKQFWAILVVAIGFMIYTGNALATTRQANHVLIPGGVSTTNAKAAWSKINSRAVIDPGFAQMLASQANVSVYNPGDWRAIGYGRASAGTSNTSVLGNGQLVPAQETKNCHVGAKVLIVVNKTTNAKLEICTACGNPRLRQVIIRIPKRPWALGTVIRFRKHVVKSIQPLTCPSGDKVTGRLDVWVKGLVKARTWGQVQGAMSAKQKLQINLAITAQVKLKCKASPPQSPRPAITQTAAQACSAKGGAWDSSLELCTIIQIVGNCSNITVVNGNGNVVTTTQEGNCNTETPPTPPVTPPTVSHFTGVTCTGFEEISGGASMLIKCDVTDDNGAPIALSVGVSDSNVVKVSGINCYSQGGPPSCSGNGQFEFRVNETNDGSTVLQESVTVTATANGVPQTPLPYYFLVDPSGGGFV
jgi:archaellum component FlaF (FlaF/FlaG flagellin family)